MKTWQAVSGPSRRHLQATAQSSRSDGPDFTRRAISQTYCCQHLCLNGKPFLLCLFFLTLASPSHHCESSFRLQSWTRCFFGRTHGTEVDPLENNLLATRYICSAAEVGSFFAGTAHRRTSYVRTVVVCSLVISSSESTKTSSPAVGDKMARRSHIFPLSIQSFLFFFSSVAPFQS